EDAAVVGAGTLAAEDEDLVGRADVRQPRDRRDDHEQRDAEHRGEDDEDGHWAPPFHEPDITCAMSMPSVPAISLNSAPTVCGYADAYAAIVWPSPPSSRLTWPTLTLRAARATSAKIASRFSRTNMSIALPPLSRHASATIASAP